MNLRDKRYDKYMKIAIMIYVFFIIVLIIANTLIVGSNIFNLKFISNFKAKLYKHDSGEEFIVVDDLPMVDYGYKRNIYVGVQLYPLFLARFAQENISTYLDNPLNIKALDSAIKLANWLIDNKQTMTGTDWENGTLVNYNMWICNYSMPYPDMPIEQPFYSALAQGHIIDLFENLFLITNNTIYHENAKLALNAFKVNIHDQGLLIIEKESRFWLPEIIELHHPTRNRFILGGFIHTIKNLIEIKEITKSTEMRSYIGKLVNFSITNLEDKIHFYDYKGVWTYYDRIGHIAADTYKELNTFYLGWLYNYTNSLIIYEAWQKLFLSPYNSFPRDLSWYWANFWENTRIYFVYDLIIAATILFISIPLWVILWFKFFKNKTNYTKHLYSK